MNMTHRTLSSFIYVLSYFYILMLNFYHPMTFMYITHTRLLSLNRQGRGNNLRSLGICMRHHRPAHSGGTNVQYTVRYWRSLIL